MKLPLFALLLCCMIWGTTFLIVKDSTTKIDPYLLSVFRNGIAVIFLLPFLLIKNKESLRDKKAQINGLILGLFLAAIYIVQTIGLTHTSTNHSAFITSSAVIMVPLLLVWQQKIYIRQWLALALVFLGLLFLTHPGNANSYNKGDLITFAGAIICACHIILAGKYVRKTDFLGLVFYQFLFACLLSMLGCTIRFFATDEPILLDSQAFMGVVYLGILGTLFCFFVTVWAQKYVSTLFTAMIFSLEPLFASFSNYLVNDEGFTLEEGMGAVIIFLGIILYSIPRKKIANT